MSVQTTSRSVRPAIVLAPQTLAALLGATMLLGGVMGTLAGTLSSSGGGTVAAPAAFDAVEFRAEEKAPLQLQFDPVRFRAQERSGT